MANTSPVDLENTLEKAFREEPLTDREIYLLLGLKKQEDIDKLFSTARNLRQRYFGSKIFLYGFINFSTWCRNNCKFCFYRSSNLLSKRYRKTEGEIIEAALKLAKSGVHLVDLTMGEDPYYHCAGERGFNILTGLAKAVKNETGLPVMVSPGVVPDYVLREFVKAGVDWYACYQETHNRKIFKRLRVRQSYDARFNKKVLARKLGLLIEEGILTGVGESLSDIVASLNAMRELGAHQVRVMSFVPQKGTPMEKWPSPPRIREYIVIAVMRLLFPDRLIPASLDVDGIKGLSGRLDAGANVITSLIPQHTGLTGVAQNSLDIDKGRRTVASVLPVLESKGLAPATANEYKSWVNVQKYRACLGNRGDIA